MTDLFFCIYTSVQTIFFLFKAPAEFFAATDLKKKRKVAHLTDLLPDKNYNKSISILTKRISAVEGKK